MGNFRSVDITNDNESQERGGCMARFRGGLYSVHIESCVITLTLVSVLAITGELLINLHVVQVPPKNGDEAYDNTSEIDVRSSQNSTVGNPMDPGGSNSVDPLQTPHQVFHYISLVIAAIFLIEIMLKILVKGKSFFLRIFQVADALIVLGTFALEVVFTVEQEELPLLEAATYIVILRLWRVPYVCNIKAKECKREMQQELEVWQSAKYKLEERCRDMQTRIDKQQEQMRDMEKQLEKYTFKDKHTNFAKKTETGLRKEKTHKAPVSNGHIPHVKFSEIDEENSNHVIKSANQQWVAPLSDDPSVDSVDCVLQESNKDDIVSDEHVADIADAMDTNSTHEEILQDRGPFSRTDSESSLSCDHVEQEVVVQIEGPPSPKQKLSTTDETANLIEAVPEKGSEEFSYSNAMFEDEIGHHDLPVLHEIDGVKTYRRVDGIPMTSL